MPASPKPPPVQSLQLLPSVDVQDGRVVQLVGGAAGSETVLGDPTETAEALQRQGATWVHLVDVDAAFGRGHNRDVLAAVVGRLDIPVEVAGGIRDDESLAAALATGCERVVLGAEAMARPIWCAQAIERHGDRVAVALDVRGRTLAPRGGHPPGGDLHQAIDGLERAGCARYVVTDVDRDGGLAGQNLDLIRTVCAATNRPVVASGGIATLDDLVELRHLTAIGVEGAIIGRALHEGRFTLAEALATAGS